MSLSAPLQQLIEIVKALRKESKILVLDEPTSALAGHEIELLFKIMRNLKQQGASMVYITHKIDEVFRIADRITVLRDGKTVNTDMISNWTRQSVVRAMVGRELKDMFPMTFHKPGKPLLEVENLSVEDPEIKGRMILENVSFCIHEREILGISGLMGAGRTELLSTIFGNPPGPWKGKIRINGKDINIKSPHDAIAAGLGFVPEDRKNLGLVMGLPVIENLSMPHLYIFCKMGFIDSIIQFCRCQDIFRDLDIRAPSLYVGSDTLSGGNQQKTVLGKWLLKQPKVLFLDEPTRGIDVGAKKEIHQIMNRLKEQNVGIVMISSELPEILGVSDRILVVREGKVAGEFSRREATQEKIMEIAT